MSGRTGSRKIPIRRSVPDPHRRRRGGGDGGAARRGPRRLGVRGHLHPQIGLNAVAGWNWEDFGLEPYRFEMMRQGCYDPRARIADMDVDGV